MPTSTVLRLVAMVMLYVALQAALSRWLIPGGGIGWVPTDAAPVVVWLGFAVWGAAVLRKVVPLRWRPVAGVVALLLLIVVLFIVALFTDCLANPRGCEL